MEKQKISIILPVLNERELIEGCLEHLLSLKPDEIIVADGGSSDGTAEWLRDCELPVQVIQTPPGRARQMNAGAVQAKSEILLFAHADLIFPADALARIRNALEQGREYGGFFKKYRPESFLMKLYRWSLNHLYLNFFKRLVGSNGLFMNRSFYHKIGGFPNVPFMEDLELMREALRHASPTIISDSSVLVSSRRYQQKGSLRQMVRNGLILFQYTFLKKSPQELEDIYRK